MAEQEVIKQTKKLFGIWKTNSSFLHKTTDFILEIFIIDPAYNICFSLTFVGEILGRYDTCIYKMNTIIQDINKQYKE